MYNPSYFHMISVMALLLLVVVPSCDQRGEGDNQGAPASDLGKKVESAQDTDQSEIPEAKIERIFRQRLSSRAKYSQIAQDAALFLRDDDQEGFATIVEALSRLQKNGRDLGIELMPLVDPENRAKLLTWLGAIPDQNIRFNATSGAIGQLITTDPENGLILLRSLGPELLATQDSLGSNTLEQSAWWTAGRLLVEDANLITTSNEILLEASKEDRELLRELVEGAASAAANSIRAGKDMMFLNSLITGLPSDLRGDAVEQIVNDMIPIKERGMPAVMELLQIMSDYPEISSASYLKLGANCDFATFLNSFATSNIGHEEVDPFLIKGWALYSPERAVQETMVSRPDLAPAAFEAWIESDSVEASAWLNQADDGPTKTACISKLCSFLLANNSPHEAENWLKLLPEDEKSRILESVVSPNE